MSQMTSLFGQPIGHPLPGWTERPHPARITLEGAYCRLEPLDAAHHAESLFAAFAGAPNDPLWTYLPYGPFAELSAYKTWLASVQPSSDPLFFTIVEQETDAPMGLAAYLRIEPKTGVIEVGHINYAPRLQQTRAATEAMFLMMRHVFDELGYRRYEWKCDALNAPSRRAAERLGFQFEGLFRQATMYKGRNRDTAWFSIIDSEWPGLKAAFEQWLHPSNFDAQGRQKARLQAFMGEPRID
ncbi:MAG: GNAT family protein [Caldilineaceae bacterium]